LKELEGLSRNFKEAYSKEFEGIWKNLKEIVEEILKYFKDFREI
jgi:hypothetical protein